MASFLLKGDRQIPVLNLDFRCPQAGIWPQAHGLYFKRVGKQVPIYAVRILMYDLSPHLYLF
jgi:hypothetical protein